MSNSEAEHATACENINIENHNLNQQKLVFFYYNPNDKNNFVHYFFLILISKNWKIFYFRRNLNQLLYNKN